MSLYLEEQHCMDVYPTTSSCGGQHNTSSTDFVETRMMRNLRHQSLSATVSGENDTSYPPLYHIIPQGPLHHQHIQQHHHDSTYYRHCMVGGILSSSIRWVLTPLDSMKCNMQVYPTKYPSFLGGLQMVYQTQGIRGLYKGLTPTILSYSTQTGTKYALYEYLKDHMNPQGSTIPWFYKSLIYIVAAGTAEAVADILMCPWETLKVQMQTSTRPLRFLPALVVLVQRPTTLIEALPPLWSRQILGTIGNFLTFEHTSNIIYKYYLVGVEKNNNNGHNTSDESRMLEMKSDVPIPTQLAVTLCSGFISGIVSTIISHPADSLLTLKARYPESSMAQLIRQTGWRSLATKGLVPRMGLTGSIIGFQWLAYDTFKTSLGMGTTTTATGGGGGALLAAARG